MRQFKYDEKFKGQDIMVGTAMSSWGNKLVNGTMNIVTPNTYGNLHYNEQTNQQNFSFVNGHRFIGENILIKKGRRFKIETKESFTVNIK